MLDLRDTDRLGEENIGTRLASNPSHIVLRMALWSLPRHARVTFLYHNEPIRDPPALRRADIGIFVSREVPGPLAVLSLGLRDGVR